MKRESNQQGMATTVKRVKSVAGEGDEPTDLPQHHYCFEGVPFCACSGFLPHS
jgi:hypothetical protein